MKERQWIKKKKKFHQICVCMYEREREREKNWCLFAKANNWKFYNFANCAILEGSIKEGKNFNLLVEFNIIMDWPYKDLSFNINYHIFEHIIHPTQKRLTYSMHYTWRSWFGVNLQVAITDTPISSIVQLNLHFSFILNNRMIIGYRFLTSFYQTLLRREIIN